MKERVEYIDRLKGFAMLAVIIGHLTVFSYHIEQDPIGLMVTTFHMPVFMFMSGLVISTPPNLLKLVRKLCRFLCPMLVVGSIFSLTYFHSIVAFFLDGMKKGYWYLLVLSFFYVLLLLFHRNAERKNKNGFIYDITVFIGVYVVILALKYLLPRVYGNIVCIGQCAYHWPWFIGGYLARKYQVLNYFMKNNWIFSMTLILYLMALAFFEAGYYHIYMIASMFAIPTFVYIFRQRQHNGNIVEKELTRLGRCSLDIYIYHFFMVKALFLNDFGTWVSGTDNYLLELGIDIVLAIAIGYSCVLISNILHKSNLIENVVYGKFADKILK